MNPFFSSTNQAKPYSATKLGPSKAKSKDRHVKVNGRDRRVRIPKACAARVFQLSEVLGHRTGSQTIEWLIKQAEPAINEVLGTTTPTVQTEVAIQNSATITPRSAAISPPQLPPLPVSMMPPTVAEREGSAATSGNGESELSIDDYPIYF